MNINWKINKGILIQALKELADETYQRRIWLNTGDRPGMTLSFTEAAINVFDDACVAPALEEGKVILDPNVTQALQELHNATNAVSEYRPPEEIINDPMMETVRQRAARVLSLIEASDGRESTIEIVE